MNILLPRDLLYTAEKLAGSNARKPRQSDLKRAASTVYYALFHALAKSNADCLIGTVKLERANRAWRQVYRSLDHGFAKSACQNSGISQFPQQIQDFADIFVALQAKRHSADYDPFIRLQKLEVLNDIKAIKQIIDDFQKTGVKDRKAFAVWVLLKQRS